MIKFAAHDDTSIYAVADSAEAAIEKARNEARDQTAQFQVAPISDELAAQIERDGWDGMHQSFAFDGAGFIVDTTNWWSPVS